MTTVASLHANPLQIMKENDLCIAIMALALLHEVSSASSIIIINRRHTLKKLMFASSTTLMCPKPSFATTDTTNLNDIDWNSPKSLGLNTERMCDGINDSIRETSWLVTGLGSPSYFSDGFLYQSDEEDEANVRIRGYEAYCRWINNTRYIGSTAKPQCDLICCSVTAKSTITALWRLGYHTSNSSIDENKRSKVYLSTFITSNDDQGGLVISQNDKVLIATNAPSGAELRAKCNWYSCMPESLL
eukprot:scaffold1681_cov113-Skeletonema_dohrnii-CCMP3373.AAC.8